MRGIGQIYKSALFVIVFVFGVLSLYTINAEEPPRFILFFGRFHPLLLHLPIGALVVTFFIDVVGRMQKNYSVPTVQHLLGFTALFSVGTCFLGYFLSLEGGYQKETLDLHFYTGILTAILTVTLFFLSLKQHLRTHKSFLIFFILGLISISITGHYGSTLTHGENFLTEYATFENDEKTIETIDSLKLYEHVVAKILDEKCIQCHNTSKQKGDLSLSSEETILKGGKNGSSVVPGDALASLLYSRMLLPISDKEHMPPEGKAQLTKDEIWLIQHWLDQGVDFDNYAVKISENDTLKRVLQNYLIFEKIQIPLASREDIDEVRNSGFRVQSQVPGQAALIVKSLSKDISKESMNKLSLLKEQIVELDLSNSKMTNKTFSVVKKLKNLTALKVTSPEVTDESLTYLKKLSHLKVLNVYNTGITKEGLSNLLTSIQPEQIYAWKTKVSPSEVKELENKFRTKIQVAIVDGFAKKSQLEPPVIRPPRTLFMDTIHVNAFSRLKYVELRYTLDGSIPDSTSSIFTEKLILGRSQTFQIAAFKEGWLPSKVVVKEYAKIRHQVADFTIKEQPSESYPNPKKFFDVEEGSLNFRDGHWVGFFGKDLNVTVDLGAAKSVNQISFNTLEDVGSWILYPTNFTVYASNSKNGSFKKVGTIEVSRKGQGGEAEMKKVHLDISETNARFFKIVIKNHKKLPDWHASAGNPSWLFVDEIYFGE